MRVRLFFPNGRPETKHVYKADYVNEDCQWEIELVAVSGG